MSSATGPTDISKTSFWVTDENTALHTSLHRPTSDRIRKCGVLICNPIGHEYIHGYRTLRKLADRLAASGFPVVRFDYAGTGNSTDPADGWNPIERWTRDIGLQCDNLSRMGVEELCIIGYRFGASIAAAAVSSLPCQHLIAWAPYASGRKYVRELSALSLLADYERRDGDDLECAGFVYPDALIEGILSLDSSETGEQPDCKVTAVGPNRKSFSRLKARFGQIQEVAQDIVEYDDSLLEPHLAQLPDRTINTIVEQLKRSADDFIVAPNTDHVHKHPEAHSLIANTTERIVWSDEPRIAGVLSMPKPDPGKNQTIVIMPNAGSVHNVGPNRVYVALARALAEKGVATLRFDQPNLGESVIDDHEVENHPYPAFAASAMADAIAFLTDDYSFDNTIVAGLCSGSYTAFRYVLSRPGTPNLHLAMINPLTFYWEDGMQLRLGAGQTSLGNAKYYKRALADLKAWKRLLRGETKINALTTFVFDQTMRIPTKFCKIAFDWLRLTPRPRLAKELLQIANDGIAMNLFISSRDIGLDIMCDEGLSTPGRLQRSGKLAIHTIQNGDHTFSHRRERLDFVDKFVRFATEI